MLTLFLSSLLLAAQAATHTTRELVWTVEELAAGSTAPAAARSMPAGWSHRAPLLLDKQTIGAILRDASGWKQRVLRGDALGPLVDEVRPVPVAATSDRRHVAYTARRDGKTLVVLDERVFELPDGTIEQLALSPDGAHIAYVQRRGAHAAVGFDGVDLVARCGGVGTVDSNRERLWCFFPPDGSAPAFAVYDEQSPRPRVWWRGATEPSRIWVDLESLVFSPDAQRLACSVDGERVVVLDAAGARTHLAPGVFSRSLVFSPDSRRVAWANERGVFVDGEILREERADRIGAFPTAGSPLLRSSLWLAGATEPAYVVLLSQGAAFRKDGKLWREVDAVRALPQGVDVASGRVAVEVRRGGATTWMVEGTPGELFPRVGRIAFVAGGRTVFCGGEAPAPAATGAHGGVFSKKSPLAGALDRLEGRGKPAAAPQLLALFTVVVDGRKGELPLSLDLDPPSVSPNGRRIAYRTASGLSPDRTRALSPGVCVVDLDASPPTFRVHAHEGAHSIHGDPVFSADCQQVAYLVTTSSGAIVAVDGACADRSYAGFATWPRFTGPQRVEATAIRLDGTARAEVPIAVTRREVVRTAPVAATVTPPTGGTPAPEPKSEASSPDPVSAPPTAAPATTLARTARRKPRELFRSALRMQPEAYWYVGRNALSAAEIEQVDAWCRKNLDGTTLEFDAVLEGLRVGQRGEGGTQIVAVFSCEALLIVDRGPVDLVLEAWMPGMMELQVQALGVDPSFMPYRRPFLWRATLSDVQVEQLGKLVGHYLPVRARVGLLENLGAFVGRPNLIMGTDAMAFLALSLRDAQVTIPERGDAGIEAPTALPPSVTGPGAGGALPGTPCALCNGTGYLRSTHGANVAGMRCVTCGGKGRR